MPIARKTIAAAARELAIAAKKFRLALAAISGNDLDELDENEIDQQIGPVEDTMDNIHQLLGSKAEFASFFKMVGTSLADAQRDLDQQSRTYIDQLRRTGQGQIIPPSVFRIPKLTADVRFAMETKSREKVNLIFYSNSQQASTLHQQALKFDITATPPPPEVLQVLSRSAEESLWPQVTLVLDPGMRAAVLDGISMANQPANRTLIVATEPNHYLLGFATQTGDPGKLGVWHLHRPEPADDGTKPDPILDVVIPYAEATAELLPLKLYVRQLIKTQTEYLGQLGS